MLIDTHCHLHDLKAFPFPEEALARAIDAGVGRLIVVGVNPEDWERAVAFAESHTGVFALVGWHPNQTADYTEASLQVLEKLLGHPKVLALGEIGLDYHWDFAPREIQFRALHAQLDLAERLALPVVFHAREAYGDLLGVLEKRRRGSYLFHCFAGTAEEAGRGVLLGAYFGVDGPITYKKADELRRIVAAIPRDRLVVETDSPYLTPVPFRGKPNEPAYVKYVNAGLAAALGLSEDECAALTTENAGRFFRFSEVLPS